MISKLRPRPSAATISVISGVMLPASFRTGTTMETAGGAALADVSLMLCPSFLRGDELAGHPLDAPERWPREWPNAAVGIEPEGEPARGKPVPHQERADHADDGAHGDVARKMRREHDP